jgi:hypothetical protein
MRLDDPEFLSVVGNANSRLDLWIRILKKLQLPTIMEVGVWKGEYAEEVLRQCNFISQYYMVDPWATLPDWNKPFNVAPKQFDEVFEEAMRRTAFAESKRIILRGRTKEVIEGVPDNSVDFAYIDGDHTLRGITIDLIKVLPKIKDGGFIGGDDFTNTPWQHDVQFEPTLVCPFSVYFAEAMDLPIAALPFNQFLIQKAPNSKFAFIDTTGGYGNLGLNRIPLQLFASTLKNKVKQLLKRD